jgi:hypothetical protein
VWRSIPAADFILIGKKKLDAGDGDSEDEQFADAEDLTSQAAEPVLWQAHTAAVCACAREFAARCLYDGASDAVIAAAQAHDSGQA